VITGELKSKVDRVLLRNAKDRTQRALAERPFTVDEDFISSLQSRAFRGDV